MLADVRETTVQTAAEYKTSRSRNACTAVNERPTVSELLLGIMILYAEHMQMVYKSSHKTPELGCTYSGCNSAHYVEYGLDEIPTLIVIKLRY